MAARCLASSAAGLENGCAIVRRETCNFVVAKSVGGEGWDCFRVVGVDAAGFAETAVRSDVFKLQGKQVASECSKVGVTTTNEGVDALGNF